MNASPEVIVLIGVFALFGGLFLGIMLKVRKIAGFIYVNTKIAIRKYVRLDPNKAYDDTRGEKPYARISQYLEYTKKDITTSSDEASLLAQADYVKKLLAIKSLCPRSGKDLINIFVMRWEATQLVHILRVLKAGIKPYTLKVLDVLNKQELESLPALASLKDVETLDDFLEHISSTSYANIFENFDKHSQSDEDRLDAIVFDITMGKIEELKIVDKEIIVEILKFEFDIQNTLTVLKSILRNDPKRALESIIRTNTDLQKKITEHIESLIVQKNRDIDVLKQIDSLKTIFNSTSLSESYNTALNKIRSGEDITAFEYIFEKALLDHITEIERAMILGPVPLLSYIYKARDHMQNVSLISQMHKINKAAMAEVAV